jgi:hypothetical protein
MGPDYDVSMLMSLGDYGMNKIVSIRGSLRPYRPPCELYSAHHGGSTMAIDSQAATGLPGPTAIGKTCLFTFVRLAAHLLFPDGVG